VLRETTSRGLCELVCPSRTSERKLHVTGISPSYGLSLLRGVTDGWENADGWDSHEHFALEFGMGDLMRKTAEVDGEEKIKGSQAMSWGSRASASGRTWVKTNGKYAPAVSFLIGLSTLVGIYAAAQNSNHVPPGIWWPVISLLGIHLPERAIYLLGFTGTAAGIVGAHSQKYYVT